MSKTKPENGTSPGKSVPKSKAAEKRVQVLRDFYEIGKKTLESAPKEGAKHHPEPIRDIAEEKGLGLDMIRKAREFARRYTQTEFDELCGLRTPDGMPLTFMHVRRLLAVKNKKDRSRLQKKAASEGWGVPELVNAIKRLREPLSVGGRHLKEPKSLGEVLDQITVHTEEWLRRYEKAWKWGESGPFTKIDVSNDDEQEELRATRNQVRKTLMRLGKAADELTERLKELRLGKKAGNETTSTTRISTGPTAGKSSNPSGPGTA